MVDMVQYIGLSIESCASSKGMPVLDHEAKSQMYRVTSFESVSKHLKEKIVFPEEIPIYEDKPQMY